jgi:hypothetical protein
MKIMVTKSLKSQLYIYMYMKSFIEIDIIFKVNYFVSKGVIINPWILFLP